MSIIELWFTITGFERLFELLSLEAIKFEKKPSCVGWTSESEFANFFFKIYRNQSLDLHCAG